LGTDEDERKVRGRSGLVKDHRNGTHFTKRSALDGEEGLDRSRRSALGRGLALGKL